MILNQFSEFGNYLCPLPRDRRGARADRRAPARRGAEARAAAFVAATGSAGTIAAGDYLKERHGALIVAAEALECPTLLYNGFGEHNIQGIGDKHVPLYPQRAQHRRRDSPSATARPTRLGVLLGTDVGREASAPSRRAGRPLVAGLAARSASRASATCSAAIKTAKYYGSARTMSSSPSRPTAPRCTAASRRQSLDATSPAGFDECGGRPRPSASTLLGTATDHFLELGRVERERIFNLGYFTWVEQQGVSLEDFQARRDPVLLERPPRRRARLGRA